VLGAAAIGGLLRLWRLTLRVRHVGEMPGPRVLAAFHEDVFALLLSAGERDVAPLISRSRDGERAARALATLGVRAVRGSSSRGGVSGLRAALRELRDRSVFVAVDGPRGPRGRVAPGAAGLARMGGVPLVPVAVRLGAHVRLGTWDRLALPLPFSRLTVHHGAPVGADQLAWALAALRARERGAS
jgi:lysophospholipid acyltransferase (LPLAT)-like uncharacterized protein